MDTTRFFFILDGANVDDGLKMGLSSSVGLSSAGVSSPSLLLLLSALVFFRKAGSSGEEEEECYRKYLNHKVREKKWTS